LNPPYASLAGVVDFARDNLGRQIEENLVEFFNWGFVNAGGFSLVPVSTPGTPDLYSPDETLLPVHIEGAQDFVFWQSTATRWCYEQGTDAWADPLIPQGVYVNGTFYRTPTAQPPFVHTLDFRNGRVRFALPQAQSSVIQVAYSPRTVGIYDSDHPWFRPVVLGDYGTQQTRAYSDTEVAQLLDGLRLGTPFVIIQSLMDRQAYGYEMGSAAGMQRRSVLFHIVAANGFDLQNIADAISLQEFSTIYLFNTNARRMANAYPLNFNGSPPIFGTQYPQIVSPAPDGFQCGQLHFAKMSGSDVSRELPLFRGIIRATVEVLWRAN
jgi:hypothetical protein